MSEWIKSQEQLPEGGEEVLITAKTYSGSLAVTIGFQSEGQFWYDDSGEMVSCNAPYWMPKPIPPAVDLEGELCQVSHLIGKSGPKRKKSSVTYF